MGVGVADEWMSSSSYCTEQPYFAEQPCLWGVPGQKLSYWTSH